MKIGNIIYQDDLVNHEEVDYINYIQEPINFSELNTKLPTLYVGWRFLKGSNEDDRIIQQQSILDKKIVSNLLFWEFSFKENKSQHVNGVDFFVNDVPYYFFTSKYNYINLDPVFFHVESIEDLYHILPKDIDAYYNYKGEMLYLLKDQQLWGLDLNMYEFFDFNIEHILIKITNNSTKIFTDLNGESHQKYYKIFPNFENLKRYMVVLMSKE